MRKPVSTAHGAVVATPPSIDRFPRRRSCGMGGTGISQIARKINGGQWSGTDRVQVVAR
ncbi:hypothetical protein [Klebsiella pneumoniae]|uniref:hypothetical protein n=1 Tax=Klebsiella pneumoniae TaxID=573 RepID=UPI0022B72066|nr:hypothetical protein [Klebsiella pneumoniae]